MRISILQTDIVWENKQENLRRLREKLETLRGTTEIVVLPETFSTGFSMDTASLAEPTTGETIATLRQWSEEYRLALAGSYIACETASEGGKPSYYNRAFFLTPEGNAYYYDKRHLFRMGHETEHFTPGNRRPIIRYRGWNILLLVCYDLRFPVWSRNTSNEYDLLIYVANWPIPRRKVWDILLQARALENISYVCGVNRIGKDGRLWAMNPENGFFGVAPGTNEHSNPNALATTKKDTIFTNVVHDLDNNTVWWEGLDNNPPKNAIDWKGNKWDYRKYDKKDKSTCGAHPNSRFTAKATNCPCLSSEFNNPTGVPLSAIVFGGSRAKALTAAATMPWVSRSS